MGTGEPMRENRGRGRGVRRVFLYFPVQFNTKYPTHDEGTTVVIKAKE